MIGGALETEDGLTRIALMDRNEERTRPTERDANAARLALCWNMHDELAEALRACSEYFADIDFMQPGKNHGAVGQAVRDQARAVLAKLERSGE